MGLLDLVCMWVSVCAYSPTLGFWVLYWKGDVFPWQIYSRHRTSNPLAPVPWEDCVQPHQQLSVIQDNHLYLRVGFERAKHSPCQTRVLQVHVELPRERPSDLSVCFSKHWVGLCFLTRGKKKKKKAGGGVRQCLNRSPLCNSNMFPSCFLLEIHCTETEDSLIIVLKNFRK